MRLGVGAPPEKWELIDFVLGVPKGEDALLFQRSIEHGAQAAKLLLTEGVEAAQRAYNGRITPGRHLCNSSHGLRLALC